MEYWKGNIYMKIKRIVLALGGNALQSDTGDASAYKQLEACKNTAKSIVDLIEDGHEIIIVHGNGPQVGQIISIYEQTPNVPLMPLPECGAMSQGYIGYHLQQVIKGEINRRGLNRDVVSLITQVEVDASDQGFDNPTKPIGSFFGEEEATKLSETKGYVMKEDAGRGWRRVVSSPEPVTIVESNAIKCLVEAGYVVIAAGGGGVPVIDRGSGALEGVPAVIDKDLAAEKISEIVDADMLMVLTAVEKAYINFNKPDQRGLSELTVDDAERYIEEGHFAAGSMLPKIQAAIKFVKSKPDRVAIITSLEKVKSSLEGRTGTLVKN